jgi:prepilin-type N-terminal cleavage/methylation domain-containing protein
MSARSHRLRRRKARAGFVLMEVLVSVAILAVGVTVLLESIINSLDASVLTQQRSRAVFLAETMMWQLESRYAFQREMSTGPDYGEFDSPFQQFSWETEVEYDDDAVEYQLKVTIFFDHADIRKEFALETVVPMRRDDSDLKL